MSKGKGMTGADRRKREQLELRQRILDTAREIAREQGWGGVTLREIAKRIEYSHPALYAYFQDKDALLHEIVRDGFRHLLRDLHAAKESSTDPRAALYAMVASYQHFAERQPEVYQVMYGLGSLTLNAKETWDEGQLIGDIVTDVVTHFVPDRKLAEQEVLLLWSTVHGIIALTMSGRVTLPSHALTNLLSHALDCTLTSWNTAKR